MRSTSRSVIRTAVFPVAGRGTRFLPATKASPKEMLPVVDKPLIQYAVEEALAAGAQRLVFITGATKRAIEDHFDSDPELEHMLEQQGKSDLLNQLRSVLPSYASCIYIRQPAPLGLGHAVLCAQPAVGAEPFFVHLADDLILSEVAVLGQMAQVYDAKRASILGVEVVPRSDTDKYGIVAVEADRSITSRVRSIVEKPKPAAAPSTLAVVGRYVLAPAIFEHLERIGRGAGGEIQLTDGIASLMREEAVYAYRFEGKRYDCGSKLGYLQATVEYALGHPALGREFRRYLQGLDIAAAAQAATAARATEATERESKTGTGGFGGVEGQQRIAQRARAQAAAAIADLDAESRCRRAHADRDGFRRGARLGGVLEQVDHHLRELTLIEACRLLRHATIDAKRHGGLEPCQEALPRDRCRARPRQLGEARVAVDEARQVCGAVGDGREHPLELCRVRLLRQQLPGVSERGDGRQRVIELVRNDADHLLPDGHLLRCELAGELLQQHQAVRSRVQPEAAL